MDLRVAFVVLFVGAFAGFGRSQTDNSTVVEFDAGRIRNTSDAATEDAVNINIVVEVSGRDITVVTENATDNLGVVIENDKHRTAAASENATDNLGVVIKNDKHRTAAASENAEDASDAVTESVKDSSMSLTGTGDATTGVVKTTSKPEKWNMFSNIETAIGNVENVFRSVATDLKKTTTEPEIAVSAKKIEVTSVAPKQTPKTKVTDAVSYTTPETVTDVPEQTYKEAEKEITDFVNSILRSLLPQIVGGSGGAKLSPRCTGGMMKIFGYIRRMKGWTLKMLDSMGKPSSGILKGTAYSMGNYDQCLDLSVTSRGAETTNPKDEMFRGKYCRVRVQFPQVVIDTAKKYHKGIINETDLGRLKDTIQVIPYIPVKSNYMSHFLGLCFPSTCTNEDLKELVKLIPFPGKSTLDKCEVKTEVEVDNTQLVIMCLFLILVLFVVVSTFIDWILHSKRQEKSLSPRNDKRCVSVTVAFSLCNNTKKLMKNIEDDGEGLMAGQTVRGIFVASVAWIILGHTYLFPQPEYYFQMSSLDNLLKYWNEGYFTTIMSFPLAIDTLFVCYGFIFTFSLWQPTLRSRDVSINVISLIIKNYIRLCLPLLLLFGVIFLLPLIGSGPFWGDLLQESRERCRANIGALFGMYSNFLDIEDQCFPHLWFVSCLAQLIVVGIFLSWILSRSVKMGVLITLLICIACNATVGIITFKNSFPPSYVAYFTEQSTSWFWKISMALPMSHFGSYAVGMLAGILVTRKDCHRARMCLAVVGWVACLGILYAIQLVLYNSRDGSFNPVWSSVFASVHRTAFAVCVAWVMVACSYGMGGFVNSIFSWRIFDPLFRLSYYAYIFHYVIISFVVSVAREHFSYDHMELILRACSYIAVTYFIVYFLYMLLEMPLTSLKAACCPKKTCQLEVTTLNNFPMHKGDIITKDSMELEGSCKLWSIKESDNGVTY